MNCKLTSFADGELQVGVDLDLEKIWIDSDLFHQQTTSTSLANVKEIIRHTLLSKGM